MEVFVNCCVRHLNRLSIFLFLFLLNHSLGAQQIVNLTDSVLIQKVDSMVLVAESIWYTDTDSALGIANNVLQLSDDQGYKYGMARGYSLLGVVYDIYGDFDLSLTNYKNSANLFLQIGNDLGLADCHYHIGLVLQNDKQFDQALKYVEKALQYYSENQLKSKIAMATMTQGNLYITNGKGLEAAIEKMKLAENIALSNSDTLMATYALNLQGDAFVESKTSLDSAITCFQKTIKFIIKSGNHWSLGFSYLGLAKAYLLQNNFDLALLNSDLALAEYKILNQKLGFRNVYDNRKEILEKQGKYREANLAYKQLNLYSDSLYNENSSKVINRLKTEYESEKQETEIASLSQQASIKDLEIKQKNQGILIGLITVLLIAGIIYFIYRQRTFKNRQSQTELEQRFLRSQLNPHFISNALMAVQNFMLKNESEKASTYLAKFSKLMREILENSRQEFIPVEDEIQMLTNYLDIHRLRMNESFNYKIEIDESVDVETDTIPPMFVQPFIENAIEHGIINAKGHGMINLNFVKEGDYISIVIKDNGGGIVHGSAKSAQHKSLSTTIIQERMALFNKSLKKKIQLVWEDIRNENGEINGTKVELKVPFSYL